MDDEASPMELTFAVLAFATAVLSKAIHAITGEWPSELGPWASAVLVIIGVAIAGIYLVGRARVESEIVES